MTALAAALLALAWAAPAAAAAGKAPGPAGEHPGDLGERGYTPYAPVAPRVVLAFVPSGTTPRELARVDGLAPGLLSAGLASVPAAQTYLDISQGNRVFDSLYGESLTVSLPFVLEVGGRVPPPFWDMVRERAGSAPADIVPGLLASTIERAGRGSGRRALAARAEPSAGAAALAAVDRKGGVRSARGCPRAGCPGMNVLSVGLGELRGLVRRLRGQDLVIAIETPPPEERDQLAVGIAGRGFEGQLTSDSTRTDGLALSTDLAPTVLERLGIEVPDAISGSPIRAEGAADPAELASLQRRLAEIEPRRGPVIGLSLLVWVVLAALCAAAFRARGVRLALRLLALSAIYLPALLLLSAALEPTKAVEGLLIGLGSPAIAALTLALAPGYAAVAVACAITVAAYAVDVIAGSPLTPLSLMGPNPALGVRFYGIGNELEAALAALTLIGAGAALAAWMPGARRAPPPSAPGGAARRSAVSRAPSPLIPVHPPGAASPRAAAAAFVLVAAVAIAVFAPGRFGADVGAAIVLAAGAAAASAAVLGARRGWALLILAAPALALAALVAVDLALGGEAHLSRSVLQAGGLDDLAEVVQRRLELSAESFSKRATSPFLLITVALIAAAVVFRRRILAWFGAQRPALAGFLGAAAATAVGTLANDSGAVLLIIGTAYLALFAAFAWASTNDAWTANR